MAESTEVQHNTDADSTQHDAAHCEHVEDECVDELVEILECATMLETRPTKFMIVGGSKVCVVQDKRSVPDLKLAFPHVSTELLTHMLGYYGSYTTAVDVLRALGDQLNQRPLTAGFWDRQFWPRPGQLPSVFSWSVVDSMESYDLVHAHDAEKEEEDEWLDDLDEQEFVECLRKAEAQAGVHVSDEPTVKAEAAAPSPRVRYSEMLLRHPKNFIAAAPRIPPLTHQFPLPRITEDEELDGAFDSDDDGMESVIYRERNVMKDLGSSSRRNNRLHVSADVLAKKQQRFEQRMAAIAR